MSAEKINERSKFVTLINPTGLTTTGVLYNGAATASGMDTQGFDEVMVAIDVGAVNGSATIDVALYENDTDTSSGSTAITSASFTQFTSASTDTQRVGSIVTKKRKRYLFAQTTKGGSTETAYIGGVAIGGKQNASPQAHSNSDFNV